MLVSLNLYLEFFLGFFWSTSTLKQIRTKSLQTSSKSLIIYYVIPNSNNLWIFCVWHCAIGVGWRQFLKVGVKSREEIMASEDKNALLPKIVCSTCQPAPKVIDTKYSKH